MLIIILQLDFFQQKKNAQFEMIQNLHQEEINSLRENLQSQLITANNLLIKAQVLY